MRQVFVSPRYFSAADILIFLLLGACIYGIIAIGAQWQADYHPVTEIDLSIGALPRYALFSAMRGLVAYILSLAFTLVVGYSAAKSKKAERIIIPLIDILQSIPVLGFLPGLVLGLIALFPKTNLGLELAAIIMIFTGQVWNMTFSFYSSLKSLPSDYSEASKIMGLTWWQKFWRLEMPFSSVNLVWNSLMSMAGGWFFLSVSEAFTLGEREYRIPGVGAYMAVAISKSDTGAMLNGIIAMVCIIFVLDTFIWHPILSWVRRFRLEDVPGIAPEEPLMTLAIRESRFIRLVKVFYRRYLVRKRTRTELPEKSIPLPRMIGLTTRETRKIWNSSVKYVEPILWVVAIGIVGAGFMRLVNILLNVDGETWIYLLSATGFTFLRVVGALALSSLWAVPVGIWIGLSAKRIAVAQPIIQIFASFPAPMLYPLALAIFISLGMSLDWSSMFLMMLGVQWYVLFNVLAGALKISQELGDSLNLMKNSHWDRWTTLYLPSVFPSLVTGWVTAAGGAWNASIVAEYISYQGKTLAAKGLGAAISTAAGKPDFNLLAASLTLMIIVVLALNQTLWDKLYKLAQSRYRMDAL